MRNRTCLRYAVVISDFGLPQLRSRIRHGLTLRKAWRIVRREARRGFNLFGGGIAYDNWGGPGGVFPNRYRSAVITVDGETLPHRTGPVLYREGVEKVIRSSAAATSPRSKP